MESAHGSRKPRSTHMQPQEAFISHSSANAEFTGKLVAVLNLHGVPTWHSERNILGAQQWHDEIGAALGRCDWFLLVVSSAATDSMWVKRELHYALRQRRFEGRIVPLLVEAADSSKLSWVIDDFQQIDFQAGFDEGCRELLRIWGIGFRPPAGAP